jgi:ribonucleoside-diphosphate reductase, beta subunit 1|nr:MAG TPA: Ribonucleotide reductase, small chain [Caudoviricetes sp.]
MGIFDKRVAFKPFEYPRAAEFVEVMQSSIWNVNEFNFTQDIQDFNTRLTEHEKEVVRRSLLAISQIEVSVKTFWAKLYEHFPKAEFNQLGTMMAYQELAHEQSYSKLLEILHLNGDFEQVLQVPEIKGRVEYLQKYMKGASDNAKQNYALNVALFSAFIENCSLFSQFFIMKSMNYHKGYFKGVDNVISATFLEEDLHANVGAWIIATIREEYPDFFDDDFRKKMIRACHKAYDAELNIVHWILQGQDLEYVTFNMVDNFLKYRFNKSMEMMGYEKLFEVDAEEQKKFEWFNAEVALDKHVDFFNKRPTNYARDLEDVTEDSIFG